MRISTGNLTKRSVQAISIAIPLLLIGCTAEPTSLNVGQAPGSERPTTTAPSPESTVDEVRPPAGAELDPEGSIAPAPVVGEGPETPPAPDIEPLDSQLANNNVRDGGLGSVCWARWEINRQVRIGVSSVEAPDGAAKAQDALNALRQVLPTVEAELSRASVPEEVKSFVARLLADAANARVYVEQEQVLTAAAFEELPRQFDYDSYPQVESYRALASEHPACEHL